MKRIAFMSALLLVVAAGTVMAANPNVNSAVLHLRVWNDCPGSTLTFDNSYPNWIWIDDANLGCFGYANLHTWSFSEDGVNWAVFNNDAMFKLSADLTISGTGNGEAGLRISPWWSKEADGKFNFRTTDGEIACFGGRLPFYSFTATNGLHYVKGSTVHVEVIYLPNGLSAVAPATIEYRLTIGGTYYTSGALAFDEGNPSEDPPYGLWGMLNDGRVGGYEQPYVSGVDQTELRALWNNIDFTALPIPVQPATWGSIKSLYR